MLALNIDATTTPLDFLLELIEVHGLARAVRLGLAHPVIDGKSTFLHPSRYPAVGRRVAEFARRARLAAVGVLFDCGWVPCMFPPGSLEQLGITADEVGRRCNPIIDILPGNQTISCYPLAALAREPVPSGENATWLADRFTSRLAPYRPLTLYAHCASCDWYRRGDCVGGCIAGAARRLEGVKRTGLP
jgi:hypothetical protein